MKRWADIRLLLASPMSSRSFARVPMPGTCIEPTRSDVDQDCSNLSVASAGWLTHVLNGNRMLILSSHPPDEIASLFSRGTISSRRTSRADDRTCERVGRGGDSHCRCRIRRPDHGPCLSAARCRRRRAGGAFHRVRRVGSQSRPMHPDFSLSPGEPAHAIGLCVATGFRPPCLRPDRRARYCLSARAVRNASYSARCGRA